MNIWRNLITQAHVKIADLLVLNETLELQRGLFDCRIAHMDHTAFIKRVDTVIDNHHNLLWTQLSHWRLPVIHELAFLGLYCRIIVLVCLEIAAPVRHCTVGGMIGIVWTR